MEYKRLMPLRKAVTGRERGPEMADFLPLMQVKPRLPD